jgi:DNA-binding response OmpR family regulator
MDKALVVDDEIDICVLLVSQLKNLGFQASYCLTVKAAHTELAARSYDLIFVDLNLTDGSGYELIHSLRLFDQQAKIIVISAYDGERQKALDNGASLYIAKPFTRKTIQESLQKLNLLNI